MKLLEKEEIVAPQSRTRSVVTPRTVARPVVKPNLHVRARLVTQPAVRRKSGFGDVALRVFSFVAIVGATYVSSTLAGYVTLERARQSARHGSDRAVYARQEAKAAREAIEALTNPSSLRTWADAHGFVSGQTAEPVVPQVAPRVEPHGGGLVARL